MAASAATRPQLRLLLLLIALFPALASPLLQAQLLRELGHRVTQDSVTRQQVESIKTSGLEKLLEDVEQKEHQLQLLTEEAERASRLGQLQWRKMDRDLQQVRPAECSPGLWGLQSAARGCGACGPGERSPLSVCSPGLSAALTAGSPALSALGTPGNGSLHHPGATYTSLFQAQNSSALMTSLKNRFPQL